MRIALNLKGIDYEQRAISLVQEQQAFLSTVEPAGFVPMLEIDGERLTQACRSSSTWTRNTANRR